MFIALPKCSILKFVVLTLLCHLSVFNLAFAQQSDPNKEKQQFQTAYNTMLTSIQNGSGDSLLGKLYDQILRFQNNAIDKEIMLRQKLRHADTETLQLFKTKDSLLTCIGREYERPMALRKDVSALEKRAAEIENTIQNRVNSGFNYFLALSVPFARQVYENDPSLRCLTCYLKVKLQKGNSKLASQLYRYAKKKEQSQLQWQQVRAGLSENEVAIEFVSFLDQVTNTKRYGALVLKKEYKVPRYIPLCTQSELSEVLEKSGGMDEEFYQQNVYYPATDNETPTLFDLVWKPLEPLINNTKKIYYAPSGDLHRLNIAAISKPALATPLHNKYEFIRINSTRSLINTYAQEGKSALPDIKMPCLFKVPVSKDLAARFFGNIEVDYYDPSNAAQVKRAALFGNIDYDIDSIDTRNPNTKTPIPAILTKKANQRQIGKSSNWEVLYGTKTEIDVIHEKLTKSSYKVNMYEGTAASEKAFKLLGQQEESPRIIHIATHGFFLADTTLQDADNQMNRSGLILAGANYAWRTGMPRKGKEDGILSAFEISIMNLQNTELVVLSACETGLGYIENNEGVFGLQRAFKRAGVKNLLVSLWSIPDNATQQLMTKFYQNCLEKDMSMRDALKAAQQWISTQENYNNPYYWAGFVLLE
jgi:CHAT domain